MEVEKVVEVATETADRSEITQYPEVRYGSFYEADLDAYSIGSVELKPSQNRATTSSEFLVPYLARKISDSKMILAIDDKRLLELGSGPRAPYATVIYDTEKDEIVRQVEYPWFATEVWFGLAT